MEKLGLELNLIPVNLILVQLWLNMFSVIILTLHTNYGNGNIARSKTFDTGGVTSGQG